MGIGTAGYTAMLCVMALKKHGATPDGGEILVTGAAGGVGSVAVALLAKLGYRVTAMTGRPEEACYLTALVSRHGRCLQPLPRSFCGSVSPRADDGSGGRRRADVASPVTAAGGASG